MSRPRTSSQSAWTYMCVAVLMGGVVAGVIVSSYTVIFTSAGLGLLYFVYLASASEDVHAADRERYPSVTPEPAPKPDPEVPLKAPTRARRVAAKPPSADSASEELPATVGVRTKSRPAAPASEEPHTPAEVPTQAPVPRKNKRGLFRRKRRHPDGSTKGLVPRLRPWKWRRKKIFTDEEVN